jgi:acetyl esterase
MSGDQKMMDELEPGVRQFQQQVNADYERLNPAGNQDIVVRRQVAEKVREPWTSGGPQMAETINLSVGERGVRIRIHLPTSDRELPALIYVHGGGWMLFSLDTHDRLMREYAARAGVAVVGIDYSLAPEVRFPVPLEEILDVIRWLRSDASAGTLRPSRIAIGGDSAGGNLALAANLALRTAGEPVLDAMLLNYGALDPDPRPSYQRYGGPEYMLTPAEMGDFWRNYLPSGAQRDPLARPLLGELHGLPPTFLCIPQCDILVDENFELAERLREAGVPVEAKCYAGATHSFLEAVSISPLADRALGDASQWLAEVLRR